MWKRNHERKIFEDKDAEIKKILKIYNYIIKLNFSDGSAPSFQTKNNFKYSSGVFVKKFSKGFAFKHILLTIRSWKYSLDD